MAERLLVIGAHAADFVWRSAGAVATVTQGGGQAMAVALSYGERGESAELWSRPGTDVDSVKKIRRSEAEQAARTLNADFTCFDLGLPALRGREDPGAAGRSSPGFRPHHPDYPHGVGPVQPGPPGRAPGRDPRPAAGRGLRAGCGIPDCAPAQSGALRTALHRGQRVRAGCLSRHFRGGGTEAECHGANPVPGLHARPSGHALSRACLAGQAISGRGGITAVEVFQRYTPQVVTLRTWPSG